MDVAAAWVKIIHIITLVTWTAGLFYLPALFAAHPGTQDRDSYYRLRAITRSVYVGIVSPAAVIAIVSGSALILVANAHGGWLALKLTAVGLMAAYHAFCGYLLSEIRNDPASYRPSRLLSLTAVPLVLVPIVLWLVLAKPV